MNEFIKKIVNGIDKTNVDFIYLIGSYSRGMENEYSDIDIMVALNKGDNYSDNQYINDTYVSIHYDSKESIMNNYLDPYKYIKGFNGVKDSVVLYDTNNSFNTFKNKCISVNYLEDFNDKINDYVNTEIVDWIEEVNKACSGYVYNNPSKMLEGLHGLTYGMLDVLAVSEGITGIKEGLLPTYKDYFKDLSIYQMLENAFGVNGLEIKERVLNGFMLYKEIIRVLNYRFTDTTKSNIALAISNIDNAIL